ncbi:MAG: PKD domain-containing protein [Sphingobacteriales bacterium]|nr:PKD domain-containing protein [Sphingobacteriales bacterium]
MSVTFKNTSGNCQTAGNTPRHKTVSFSVNVSGNYTFTFNSSGSGGLTNKMMNLYQTAFSTTNTCSNWLNSNGTYNGSSVSLSSTMTHTLYSGTTYILVVSGLNSSNVGNYTVNITPPVGAAVYTGGTPAPSAAYSYTYIAVNSANNIALVNASSNLTTLGTGTYYVYGLSYLTAALSNPNSLVGMSLTTLQNNIASGSLCADLSSNFVNVTIVSTCPLTASFVHTLDQTEYDFNASSSVGATSYAWNFGDGLTGTGATPSHTYTASGTYNVTLTITGACGSTSTVQTINFNCPADAAFTYTANGPAHSFNAQNSLYAPSYTWNFGDGTTGTGIITNHTYDTQGTMT